MTNVQFGCGLSAPSGWRNFDSSPTLRIQKIPLLGKALARKLQGFNFPDNVEYGDIIRGLPIKDSSCDNLYCSHVLEHLSYEDFNTALENAHNYLKPGGTFSIVMPDLNRLITSYIANLDSGMADAAVIFNRNTGMATERTKSTSFKGLVKSYMGNSAHLWLWDYPSTIKALEAAGFDQIRKCEFNDSKNEAFREVETESRFQNAVCLEVIKRTA
ncbi:MAG: methyltransferase domain-containing protein [Flavobacteriales bacterium]|nr:methyltransferase domain-containing protein [Flavobacteriales bacterium]MBT6978834.1 methyltransferase domain-containing protein [Flavobacteriales bacterium]